jgi:spermidine dehydrogenase
VTIFCRHSSPHLAPAATLRLMSQSRDRELGMFRDISRRDFIGTVAVGLGAASLLGGEAGAQSVAHAANSEPLYPPALTGLRGDHIGSFEAAHRMRDAVFALRDAIDTRETYELIVVGGGISGLSAAHYFRQAAGASARVLVLDNHDDFGGHAKRNEFTHDGRTWIGYGGTQSIDSPRPYSQNAKALITDLGIDVSRWATVLDKELYPSLGLGPALFFDRETFGEDRLVPGSSRSPTAEFLARTPLPAEIQAQIVQLNTEMRDVWPGLDSSAKKAQLARMSYADFVTKVWSLDPRVLSIYQTRTHGLFGFGIDAVPAQDAFGLGFPGFQGMALDDASGPGQNYDSMHSAESDAYYFHFPDGNASVARLLVRRLIPDAVPGATADDIVTARIDYTKLDVPSSRTRIRLGSTVVRVMHNGPVEASKDVTVHYVRDGKLYSARARSVVLACWHHVIPYLCPDMPAPQLAALRYAKKVPLVYTNVFVRRWTALQALQVSSVSSPGMWHASTSLDFPVSVGAYTHTKVPADPVVLHMNRAACKPGLPGPEQHRVGRAELLATPFESIERSIRDQLGRMFGNVGFDPAADILGITVNRWPHGYAYQYSSLADPFWLEGAEAPCVVARNPFGRISIANADAAAYSYTDAAIDEARRAVNQLLK